MARFDPDFVFDFQYQTMLDCKLAFERVAMFDPELAAALGLPLNPEHVLWDNDDEDTFDDDTR